MGPWFLSLVRTEPDGDSGINSAALWLRIFYDVVSNTGVGPNVFLEAEGYDLSFPIYFYTVGDCYLCWRLLGPWLLDTIASRGPSPLLLLITKVKPLPFLGAAA